MPKGNASTLSFTDAINQARTVEEVRVENSVRSKEYEQEYQKRNLQKKENYNDEIVLDSEGDDDYGEEIRAKTKSLLVRQKTEEIIVVLNDNIIKRAQQRRMVETKRRSDKVLTYQQCLGSATVNDPSPKGKTSLQTGGIGSLWGSGAASAGLGKWGSASHIDIQLSTWQPNDAGGTPINNLPEYSSIATLADQGIATCFGGGPYGPYQLRPPNRSFNTYVVEDFLVTEGKWYWEVTIVEPSPCPQLGVVASNANLVKDMNGVGDDPRGWGVDGTRRTTWDAGSSRRWNNNPQFESRWNEGDVIGFALDVTEGSMKISKNGQEYPGELSWHCFFFF